MMRASLGRLLANARAFVHGFLGLPATPPIDATAARSRIVERAERRPHCC